MIRSNLETSSSAGCTIGDLVVKAGQRDPRKTPNEEFQYVDVSSVSNLLFKITGAARTLGVDAPSRARKAIKAGDVLFATVRPTLKRIALVPECLDGEIASTGYCVLRTDPQKADPRFLYFHLLTDGFTERMGNLERGANYPAVRDSDVLSSPILLPPPSGTKKDRAHPFYGAAGNRSAGADHRDHHRTQESPHATTLHRRPAWGASEDDGNRVGAGELGRGAPI